LSPDLACGCGAGQELAEVCRHLEIAESTWHRWLAQYGGMKANEAKRLKELEAENSIAERYPMRWPSFRQEMDGGTTMGIAGCIGRVGALAVAPENGIALVAMPSVAWAHSGTRSGIDENPPALVEGSVRPWNRKPRSEAAGAHRAAP
jgi:Transposase